MGVAQHGAVKGPKRSCRRRSRTSNLSGLNRDDYFVFPTESHPLSALFAPIPVP